jgi:outer membrane protein TolC
VAGLAAAAAQEPAEVLPAPRPAPLTLAEAIELALRASPDLQAAAARTEIAGQTLARARAEFFPVLALSQEFQASNNPLNVFSYELEQGRLGSLTPSSIPLPPAGAGQLPVPPGLINLPTTYDNFHTQLRAEQQLYAGGLRLARTRSAEAERQAAQFGLAAVQNRLVFQVAEAYYRLFQAGELVKVRREAVALVEDQLKAVQARFRAQTAVQADVLQVELRLAEVREALITAVNQAELARALLENVAGASLAGRGLPEELPPAPWSGHAADLEEAVAAAVAEAVAQRPEVGEATSRRQAAEHLVRAAQAGSYPTVGVVSDYDVFTGDFRNGKDSFFVGLAVAIKLCDGGRTRADVRQAQARVRELVLRNQRLRLDIELDVRRAYLQLKDARERLGVTATAVRSAGERLRQVESQYRNEKATVTQLLEAQVGLTEARVRATTAWAEIEVARASLERAVGRLAGLVSPSAGAGEP